MIRLVVADDEALVRDGLRAIAELEDGVEATRRLLARPEPPHVIVLTTFDRNEYVYEAMRAGAGAFLLKDLRRGQLTSAIRAVVEGETLVAPGITRRLIETYCQGPPQTDGRPAALAGLTEREVEVISLVAAGHSNVEIAAEIYLAEATVKTHVARTLAKLRLRDRVCRWSSSPTNADSSARAGRDLGTEELDRG